LKEATALDGVPRAHADDAALKVSSWRRISSSITHPAYLKEEWRMVQPVTKKIDFVIPDVALTKSHLKKKKKILS